MLKPFSSYAGIFVEITKSEHKHGGKGWEFGTCLWSPTENSSGADRYSLMRAPVAGDLVLHFYEDTWPDKKTDTRLCGHSIVSKPYRKVNEEPPSPGKWGGRESYYRIELRDYSAFPAPLPLSALIQHYGDEVRKDLINNRPRFYPFNTYAESISTVQGIYLARCTPNLYDILLRALDLEELADSKKETGIDVHFEYAEARRRTAEKYFFARNPTLVKLAKQHYGTKCQGCGFSYGERYGQLGEGYIEVHHLNPLSERVEKEWSDELRSSVADVTVLCANCHRMIHRKRPAVSLEELKKSIADANDTSEGNFMKSI